jgi:hypothetical protein
LQKKYYLQPVLSYNLNKTKQVVIIFLFSSECCMHAIYQHLQFLKLSFVKQTKKSKFSLAVGQQRPP